MKLHQDNRYLAKLTALFFLIPILAFGQIVCPKANIAGFEREHEIGNIFVESNTTDISKSKIYITLQNEEVFIQSNYIPSAEFEYGIKMATPLVPEYKTLEDYFTNIYFFGQKYMPDNSEVAALKATLSRDAEIIVDPSVLSHKDFKKYNFADYKKLKVSSGDNVAWNVRTITNDDQKTYLLKYSDAISIRLENQDIDKVLSRLPSAGFNSSKARLFSFSENTATKKFIEKELSDINVPVAYNIDALKKAIIANKDNDIFLLGHIEGENFVTLNPSGKVMFEVPISELMQLQQDHNIFMMFLGCNSADIAGAGALKKFNSLDALKRLKMALKNDKMEGFLNDLSEGTLDLVIDDKFLVNESQLAEGVAGQEHYQIQIYKASGTTDIKGKPLGTLVVLDKAQNYAPVAVTPADSTDTENIEVIGDTTEVIEDPSSSYGWYMFGGIAVVAALIFLNKK